MKTTLEILIHLLEISVKRNGKDHVLTLGHLLNIVRMVYRAKTTQTQILADADKHAQDEWFEDVYRYGFGED